MKKFYLVLFLIVVASTLTAATFVDGKKSFWPVESSGSIPVSVQDQHSEIIDLHFTRFIDDIVLTAPLSIDETTLSIESDTLPVAGNIVCLKEAYAFFQASILTVTATGGTGYDLLLDMPSDYNYTIAGGCSLRDPKLNVNGSVTPVIFYATPTGLTDPMNSSLDQRWDVTRIIIQITDNVVMDDSKFGGIAALTNGLVVRKKNQIYKNIFNVKSNSDFALHAYDILYSSKAPAGFYGFRTRRTFAGQEKNGVAIRLTAEHEDEIQIIIRDDLTDLESFEASVQGHVVVD